jgi:hypothetical protein
MPTTYEPPTLQAIGFSDITENLTAVSNLSCLATLIYFVRELGEVVFGIEQAVSYYTDVLRRLGDFYLFARADSKLSDAVKRRVVDSYRTGPLFSIRHLIDQERSHESTERLELARDYVKAYYVELCAILSSVWRAPDNWIFHELLDQLNTHLGTGHEMDAVRQYEYAESLCKHIEKSGCSGTAQDEDAKRKLEYARLDMDIQDLQHLGDMAVAAWLAESVNVGKMNATGGKPLIEECVGHVADVHRLVEVYLHAAAFGLKDDPLGYGWWTHTTPVAGKLYTTTRSAFEKWIRPFWISLALKRVSSDKQIEVSVRKIRFLSPFRDYHYKELENALKEVLEHKEKYEWFVGSVDWEGAKQRLLKVFGELKELQKRADFEKLLGAQISDKKVDELKRDCLKGYSAERKICALIRAFKSKNTVENATRWSGKPAIVDVLGKEEFIEDWHVGFAGRDAIGDFVGQLETSQFSAWIQSNLKEGRTITNLTDLPSIVGGTATAMRDAGLNPRVVLIPEDHVYQTCFTSTSYWDRVSDYARNELPQWVSGFDNMHVFVWPGWKQDCVGVIDMDAFLSIDECSEGKYAPLEIDLTEMNADGIQKLLEDGNQRRLKEELEAAQWDEATFARIKLKLRITANVRLGLVNASAGLKLLLDENKVGVVSDKQAKVCHRIGCPLAEQIEAQNREFHKTAALAVRGYGYQSCEKCDPLFGSYR